MENRPRTPEEEIYGIEHRPDAEASNESTHYASVEDFTAEDIPRLQAEGKLPQDVKIDQGGVFIVTEDHPVSESATKWREFYDSPTHLAYLRDINTVAHMHKLYHHIAPNMGKMEVLFPTLDFLQQQLEAQKENGGDTTRLEYMIAKKEQINSFFRNQMQVLDIRAEEAERFWDIYTRDDLTKEEADWLFDFTQKMKKILKAAEEAGISRHDIAD